MENVKIRKKKLVLQGIKNICRIQGSNPGSLPHMRTPLPYVSTCVCVSIMESMRYKGKLFLNANQNTHQAFVFPI